MRNPINYYNTMPVRSVVKLLLVKFWRSAVFLLLTVYLFTANFSGGNSTGILHLDKLVHLGIFLLFAFVMMYDINHRQTLRPFRLWWLVLLILLGYGAGIELLQTWFIPYRSGSWYDMLFDALGTLGGIYLYFLYKNSRLVRSAASL